MPIQRYGQIMVIDTQANMPTVSLQGDFCYCVDTGLVFIFDGQFWTPSSKVQVKKSTVTIDAKTTGAKLLYTLESSSLNFYPTQVVPRNSNISGVTTGPTISIGTNSTNFNNIASSGLLSTLLSTLSAGSGVPQQTSFSPALAGGTQIFADVTIGALATSYSVKYDILGFYDA